MRTPGCHCRPEAHARRPGRSLKEGGVDPEALEGCGGRATHALVNGGAGVMVFLSAPLWLRNRITDRYWRVQEVLKHARHFRGRKNRCYRLAVRAVTRAFVRCTRARSLKKRHLRTLWINRITAASQEHGLKYPAFILNLIKCQVELNRKVLADLAIYEPKTFKSLAALSKRSEKKDLLLPWGWEGA
uniref:Large ribosomal subunit protein bL20m n=1 Tax=Bos mutus grunniens TaxID=30521 RepID=A0A8B9XAK3_BOSMU